MSFPPYGTLTVVWRAFLSGLAVLWQAPLPEDVVKLGADGIVELWHEKKLRSVGKKRAHTLIEAAKSSIGMLRDRTGNRRFIPVPVDAELAETHILDNEEESRAYHTFPDRREGSKSSLILKKPKTKKSNRVLYMTKPLKEELQVWLEKFKQDEQNASEKYSNCGQLFRLPDGLPIAPELLTKWYRQWRSAHPEFEQIVFHGLCHSSATYQLLQSDGDFKSVQGNTGHATASVLMDTYAHTQDKPRLELTEKIEANFYSQDLTPAASQPRQNEKPAATKISGKEILEAIRLIDADERRELTRALFAYRRSFSSWQQHTCSRYTFSRCG